MPRLSCDYSLSQRVELRSQKAANISMTDTLDFEDGVQKVYAGVSHVEGEHPPSGQEEMIGKMKTSLDVNVVCVEKHS